MVGSLGSIPGMGAMTIVSESCQTIEKMKRKELLDWYDELYDLENDFTHMTAWLVTVPSLALMVWASFSHNPDNVFIAAKFLFAMFALFFGVKIVVSIALRLIYRKAMRSK